MWRVRVGDVESPFFVGRDSGAATLTARMSDCLTIFPGAMEAKEEHLSNFLDTFSSADPRMEQRKDGLATHTHTHTRSQRDIGDLNRYITCTA